MKILVTGATGNVGRLVVDHLLQAGAADVRALIKNPGKTTLPSGVEVVQGYLGQVDTLPAAFKDVDRMYLAPLTRTVKEATALAAYAGVQRVVDLAGDKDSWWRPVEEAVETSGMSWTHLEAGEFMTNTFTWIPQIKNEGVVRGAYPSAANAPIALEDIAAVAARILLEDGHEGRAYQLTGPQTLTRTELVRLIGQAIGKDIPFIELTPDEALQQMTAVMGDGAQWYLEGLAQLAAHPQQAVQTVEQLTGRPGTTFAEWAVANASFFR